MTVFSRFYSGQHTLCQEHTGLYKLKLAIYTALSLNVRQLFMSFVPMFLSLGRPVFHK